MKPAAVTSIILSAGLIILLLATTGHGSIAFVTSLLALVWLVGLNRGWRWSFDAGFLGLMAAAGWGVDQQINPLCAQMANPLLERKNTTWVGQSV